MTTTDFRVLCAEVIEKVEFTWGSGIPEDVKELLNRARSALADEPAPEGREPVSVVAEPSDEEIIAFWSDHCAGDGDAGIIRLARWGNPAPQHNPWKETLLNALVCNFLLNAENEDNPKKALNDLIAWEKQLATDPLINPELQPVPISERLPEPKDCDAEGRCWWWHHSHAESGYWEGWMLRPRAWGVGRYDFDDRLVHTHWLPAHALPLPTVND